MSRPRKEEGQKALEKLENAFWILLEKHPYDEITIKALTMEAEVNHNSFYYHFRNMDEMAEQFFRKRIPADALPDLSLDLSGVIEMLENGDSEDYKNWQRISLFTCRGSDVLEGIFRRTMREHWLKSNPKIRKKDLDEDQMSLIDFVESGMVDIIAYSRRNNSFSVLISFMKSPIAAAIRSTIAEWERE